jgi:hypothetical protein
MSGRRFAALLIWLAALGLGSCADAPRAPARPRRAAPLDALGRRMNQIARALRERGYAPDPDLGGRSFLPQGEGEVRQLALRPGHCYTFVGLTSAGIQDLRFALYDPAGAEVVRDESVAPHALVHACPQVAGTYHFVASAARGTGVYDYRVHTSLPGAGRGFAGLFEPVEPHAGEASPAIDARLQALLQRMRPRGYQLEGEVRRAMLGARESGRTALPLEPGACWALAAISGEGATDIDLFLYDVSGAEVARDIGTDTDPVVELCPRELATYAAEVNMYEGAGPYALAVLRGPPDAAPSAAAAPAAPPSGSVDLAAELSRLAADMRARGYVEREPSVASEILARAGQNSHSLNLSPGCHSIVARGGPGVDDLDLYVFGPSGASVDRDIGEGAVSTVHVCVDDEGGAAVIAYRLDVKLYRGTGTYGYQVFDAPPTVRDLRALRLRELTAPLEAAGALLEPTAGSEELGTGESRNFPLPLVAGACYVAVAAGGEGVEDLDLFVRAPSAEAVASDTSTFPTAVARFCAAASGVYGAEVKMYSGSGSADFRLYRTP